MDFYVYILDLLSDLDLNLFVAVTLCKYCHL